jgi:hypothetical protein
MFYSTLTTFLSSQMEDSMLRDQIERYNQRLRDFEEKQRAYRQHQERPTDPDLEVSYLSTAHVHGNVIVYPHVDLNIMVGDVALTCGCEVAI